MELAKCVRCNKIYTRLKLTVCPTCESEEEKEIFEIQRFLRENPHSTLEEVSDATEIYLEDIDRWIDEGRLHVTIESASSRKCVVCGALIVKGKICNGCRDRLGVQPPEETKRTHYSGADPDFVQGGKYRR